MDIYWVKDKVKCGPEPVVEMISRLQRGDLQGEELAWHKGCDAWLPLRELPAMRDYFIAKEKREAEVEERKRLNMESLPEGVAPQLEKLPPEVRDLVESGNVRVRAIRVPTAFPRFCARMVDVCLYLWLYVATLRLFFEDFDVLMFTWPLFGLAYIPIEMALLHVWGTTPGKALFYLTVHDGDGTRMGWLKSFKRAIGVICFGLGLLHPFLALGLMSISWWWYRQRVITPWDLKLLTYVQQHATYPVWRVIAAVMIIFFALYGTGHLLLPWEASINAVHESTWVGE